MSGFNKYFLPALVVLSCVQANASILTFDDLPDYDPVSNGYGDLDWGNFTVLDTSTYDPVSGYANAAVSGTNVAYNAYAQTAFTSKGSLWTFSGAYLTAAWNNGLQVEITGKKAGSTLYSQTVEVNTDSPAWFSFNFAGIDELIFNSFGGVDADLNGAGTHFAMDNFTYELFQDPCPSPTAPGCEPPDEVPEPSSLGLVAIGLASLFMARRKSKLAY